MLENSNTGLVSGLVPPWWDQVSQFYNKVHKHYSVPGLQKLKCLTTMELLIMLPANIKALRESSKMQPLINNTTRGTWIDSKDTCIDSKDT